MVSVSSVIGGYARCVKIGQWMCFVPTTSTAPARFTGGFFGSRSPSSLCGCRRSGFNRPGELETPAVEGGEQNLRRKRRHDLKTVAVAWNLGFCLYPVYFGLLDIQNRIHDAVEEFAIIANNDLDDLIQERKCQLGLFRWLLYLCLWKYMSLSWNRGCALRL
ncbi:hypothetical protein HID58_042516 [Brassica napus]|uniref:BnaCnng24900D protein n=2 Tax=Brassica napus TaxID=3708 RepID=A0A078ITK0_BRANA|nr:hypothetical protein HID58_042516 [Brassica napus]CAF2073955.1 unnamed protein product [Brassica napus]CDY53332.1 BnaCnng24900D [Brassica napus]